MVTVLLVYILLANEHIPPKVPTFFTVYKTETVCKMIAERYIKQADTNKMLVNAVCVDARDPKLVPYLHDVPEVEAIDTES